MNKAITNIKYNHLNQPTEVDFGYFDKLSKQKTKYIYTATGVKLQTKIYTDNNLENTTDYSGAYVYENNKLSYTNIPGGRIINSPLEGGEGDVFQYNLTDHLGNIRVTFGKDENGEAEIIQEDHYYPFGMRMSGQHYSNTDLINKYLYNGKEQQNQTNYYDYGFRQFDAQLGRWHVVDAMAEKYFSQSPYNYVGNNPISRTDFMGLTYRYKDPSEEAELNQWLHGGGIASAINGINNHISNNLNNVRSSARNISLHGTLNGVQGTTVNDIASFVFNDGGSASVNIGSCFSGFYGTVDGMITNLYIDGIGNFTFKDGIKSSSIIVNGNINWGGVATNYSEIGIFGKNELEQANNLATVAGLFANAEHAIKYFNLSYVAKYGKRGNAGRIHNANVVTRYMRIQSLSAAKWFKVAGKGLGVLSTGIYLVEGVQAYNAGDNAAMGKAMVNATMSLVMTFGGWPGLIIGGIYFVGDAYGVWNRPTGNFSNPYPNNVTRNDNTYVVPPIIYP